MLALVFLAGGIVENQLRLLSATGGYLGNLGHFLTFQVSFVWALVFAIGGAALMLLAFRRSQGQKAPAAPRYSRLAGRVGKRERSG
ncbi:MAG: hypothetical protein IBX71_03310 [Candidatus Desulforudis sp.]|nr:hypothetical protein [Desulforudis sp.]